jgi:HD-GYP domain-containing protein (c-di-GMP phosphodiesterase class II)
MGDVRIIVIADTFSALRTYRIYRPVKLAEHGRDRIECDKQSRIVKKNFDHRAEEESGEGME